MIRDLVLPQLGMGMSEGSIADWLVADGDEVQRDQTIALIETEKVTTELPAPWAGFIHIVVPAADTKLPVETRIAQIADSRAEYESITDDTNAAVAATVHAQTQTRDDTPETATTGKTGKIRVSGLARAVAIRHGLDLGTIRGSGPSGRIIRRDVEAVISQATQQPRHAALTPEINAETHAGKPYQDGRAHPETHGDGQARRIPMTGARKHIAGRMVAASTVAAQTFIFCEADVTQFAAWHQRLYARRDELGGRISRTAIYAKALACACLRVPICNASIEHDEIVLSDHVHVGIAVALPGRNTVGSSLVVPVIRDVAPRGIIDINADIRQIVAKAREGRLGPADTAGATITLSSTEGFAPPGAWMISTPLLNLPQVVNFQPGTLVEKPLVVDGEVQIRTVLPMSLTFDHRAMDGALAAQFMRTVCEFLQEPQSMLL